MLGETTITELHKTNTVFRGDVAKNNPVLKYLVRTGLWCLGWNRLMIYRHLASLFDITPSELSMINKTDEMMKGITNIYEDIELPDGDDEDVADVKTKRKQTSTSKKKVKSEDADDEEVADVKTKSNQTSTSKKKVKSEDADDEEVADVKTKSNQTSTSKKKVKSEDAKTSNNQSDNGGSAKASKNARVVTTTTTTTTTSKNSNMVDLVTSTDDETTQDEFKILRNFLRNNSYLKTLSESLNNYLLLVVILGLNPELGA
jgi:hypothetical protein